MNTLRSKKLMTMLFIGALAVMAPQWAMALQTAPCTAVINMAKLSYSVGTAAQNEICSSSTGNSTGNGGTSGTECVAGTNGAGNTSFNVGVKVIVSVTNDDGNEVTVVPGTTKYALKFTVANTGNAVHDYALASEAAVSTTASPYGGNADSFNGTTIAIYDDTGGAVGSYDATDAVITSLNDVAADTGSKVVYIVYTPSDLTASNLSTAVYNLKATSQWANSDPLPAFTAGNATDTPNASQVSSCDGTKTVDVVAGDAVGKYTGDAARDGAHSDDGAYEVSTAAISVTKTSAVYSDPINGTSSSKAIPGAVVTYTVTISNTGSQDATSVSLSDSLNAEITAVRLSFVTQFDDGTTSCAAENGIVVDADGSGAGTPACKTNAGGDDNNDFNSTATNTVTSTGLTVNAGANATVKFQATIQ